MFQKFFTHWVVHKSQYNAGHNESLGFITLNLVDNYAIISRCSGKPTLKVKDG